MFLISLFLGNICINTSININSNTNNYANIRKYHDNIRCYLYNFS